jgi:soluble lytic murein transglycosylase-like protein
MIPYLSCMLMVAAVTGLPPRVLPVIQAIEGGSVGTVRPDANGTADLGVMQVNTIWVPPLAARAGLTLAAARQRLVDDPCFNIAASALILKVYLAQTNGALLPAIGDYHSHTPALNTAYTAQAEQKARQLFVDVKPRS